jgi:hypothetical protein
MVQHEILPVWKMCKRRQQPVHISVCSSDISFLQFHLLPFPRTSQTVNISKVKNGRNRSDRLGAFTNDQCRLDKP